MQYLLQYTSHLWHKRLPNCYCRFIASRLLIVFILLATAAQAMATIHHKHWQQYSYDINGINDKLQTAINSNIATWSKNMAKKSLSSSQFKQALIKQITLSLQPFGYFQPRVITLEQSGEHQQRLFIFDVHPGKAIIIQKISVHLTGPGTEQKVLTKAIQTFPLKQGAQLNTNQYSKGKTALLNVANQLGYLDAQYTKHQLLINRQHHIAEIYLTLNTGPRYYFGDFYFSKTALSEDFLKRYVTIAPGEPYDYQRLLDLQNDLSASGYFKRVLVTGLKQKALAYRVPVLVEVNTSKAQLYSFGLGYGTDTRARASFGWDYRWTNPHGHYITSLVSLSQIQNSAIIRYVIPGQHPAKQRYNFITAYQNIRYGSARSSVKQVAVNYVTRLSALKSTYTLSYQLENGEDNARKTRFATQYLLPSFTLSYSKTDKPFLATEGYRIDLTVRGAHQNLFSKSSFVQTEIKGNITQPLFTGLRFVGNIDFGYTTGNKLDVLPPSLQFWTGGVKLVRGYNYLSLGPGRYLTSAQFELQQHIYNDWYLTTFYDVGDAFDYFPMNLKRGVGIGLMWLSAVGPIELSIAKALDTKEQPYKIQFEMGTDL